LIVDPKPSDFEEFKRLMLKQTGSDEKHSALRGLSFSILWALAVGIRGEILRDLVELLEFEIQRVKLEES
jgi:hypothetical protein